MFLLVEKVRLIRLLRLTKRVGNILSAFGLNYVQVSPFRFEMNQNYELKINLKRFAVSVAVIHPFNYR